MGEYALLSEVYGSEFKKEKREKKSKKKIPVIEPDEMDKVLLGEQSVSPEVKVRNNLFHWCWDKDNTSYFKVTFCWLFVIPSKNPPKHRISIVF